MKHVLPLECNPDVFNALSANFGVTGVEFIDVFSLDPEMLGFYPRPVLAVLLVFPISERYESYRSQTDHNEIEHETSSEDAIWYKQTISNSCGTMAFLHAMNNVEPSQISEPLRTILNTTKPLSTSERTAYLEQSADFENVHNSVAQQGDTQAPSAGEEVEFHYVCLTKSPAGKLVELDGRRKGPIVRAEHVEDLLDGPAIKVIQEYLDREGTTGAFSMIAMCKT